MYSSKEITSTIQPNDRNQWFDQECSDANEMSNTLRINMLQRKTRASTKECKNARRNTKPICRRKKGQFEENLLYDLEDKFGQYESRECTEGICKFKMGFQPRPHLHRHQ